MRNTNKKGFTIIELVVVVAVIAILAAVLIPTFSGIIAKAKLNADEQTVTNMNKYVAAANAEEEFVFAADAVNALYANGFNVGKFKTFSKGYHYAYGGVDNNKFYLLNEKGEIVFPKSDKTAAELDLWGFFNNAKTDAINDADGNRVVTNYIALAPIVDPSVFNNSDCVFTGDKEYTIDLNGYTIAVAGSNKITLMNGTVLGNFATSFNADSSLIKRDAMTAAQALAQDPVNGVVTIENKAFVNNAGKLSFENFDSDVTAVVFKNCTFEQAANADFFIGANSLNLKSITLEKCTINLYHNGVDNGKFLTIMSSASVATDVTITGCQFSGARGVLFGDAQLVSNYGKIAIENNGFVNTVNSTKALVQFGGLNEFVASSISIKDNDFQSGQVAIRIHSSIGNNGMKCLSQNVTISGNKFAENMNKVDGDDQNAYTYTTADAWEAKIQ